MNKFFSISLAGFLLSMGLFTYAQSSSISPALQHRNELMRKYHATAQQSIQNQQNTIDNETAASIANMQNAFTLSGGMNTPSGGPLVPTPSIPGSSGSGSGGGPIIPPIVPPSSGGGNSTPASPSAGSTSSAGGSSGASAGESNGANTGNSSISFQGGGSANSLPSCDCYAATTVNSNPDNFTYNVKGVRVIRLNPRCQCRVVNLPTSSNKAREYQPLPVAPSPSGTNNGSTSGSGGFNIRY